MNPGFPSLSQFAVTEPTPCYWRVVYSNPPVNLLNSTTVLELAELVERIDQTVGVFPPEGTNIPVPGHAPASERPGLGQHRRLCPAGERREGRTKTTAVVVRSITR